MGVISDQAPGKSIPSIVFNCKIDLLRNDESGLGNSQVTSVQRCKRDARNHAHLGLIFGYTVFRDDDDDDDDDDVVTIFNLLKT